MNYSYQKTFDASLPEKYLIQLENLRDYLPHKNFEWVPEEELDKVCDREFVENLNTDSDVGYAYEVSMRVPDHLHDELSDLPPFSERITIDPSMLTDFKRTCYPDREKQPAERLSVNLFDKEKYVMHYYRTLQMCYKLKLEVTRFHRVMRFEQSPWMRSYIDFNTRKRTEADRERPRNKLKINLCKAFQSCLFGRTIMNLRKFRNVCVVTTKRHAK